MERRFEVRLEELLDDAVLDPRVTTVRTIIASLLYRALDCGSPPRVRRNIDRRLKRNEMANAYHWRSRNRLPPRRFQQRK